MTGRGPAHARRGAVSRASFLVASGDPWIRGYAAALAALVRLQNEPRLARSILDADGITLEHLIAAGVEPFDLAPLRRALS